MVLSILSINQHSPCALCRVWRGTGTGLWRWRFLCSPPLCSAPWNLFPPRPIEIFVRSFIESSIFCDYWNPELTCNLAVISSLRTTFHLCMHSDTPPSSFGYGRPYTNGSVGEMGHFVTYIQMRVLQTSLKTKPVFAGASSDHGRRPSGLDLWRNWNEKLRRQTHCHYSITKYMSLLVGI